jgi:4-hydroxybenzoate polyprenyltransferase
VSARPARDTIRIWIRLLRPVQWSKNSVVFAALVFGRQSDPDDFLRALVAFLAFCALSSATYIFNDWSDIERDRLHPVKRHRPLAAGEVDPARALILSAVLALGSLSAAFAVTRMLGFVLLAYLALMTAYTLRLKRVMILDVFVIAAGFLLRAIAGAVAVDVPISMWLMLCTMLLALFLGFAKRRNELTTLDRDASLHRTSLRGYTTEVLDQFIVVSAAAAVMAYAMYTFSADTVPENGIMMITVPMVIFAMFRYLYLVYVRRLGGAPEILLFRDVPLLGSIIVWGVTAFSIVWF